MCVECFLADEVLPITNECVLNICLQVKSFRWPVNNCWTFACRWDHSDYQWRGEACSCGCTTKPTVIAVFLHLWVCLLCSAWQHVWRYLFLWPSHLFSCLLVWGAQHGQRSVWFQILLMEWVGTGISESRHNGCAPSHPVCGSRRMRPVGDFSWL